jgi:hypothetical protein
MAWALSRRVRLQVGSGEIRVAPIEYVILRKLEYYELTGSDRHLRDVAMMLRISGDAVNPGTQFVVACKIDIGTERGFTVDHVEVSAIRSRGFILERFRWWNVERSRIEGGRESSDLGLPQFHDDINDRMLSTDRPGTQGSPRVDDRSDAARPCNSVDHSAADSGLRTCPPNAISGCVSALRAAARGVPSATVAWRNGCAGSV